MDPIVKPSFIPKSPIVDNARVSTNKSSGVFSFLILFIFIVTGVSYAYVYFQTQSAEKTKIEYIARIEKAQQEIGTQFVSEMVNLQNKITTVQTLLRDHVAVSPIFQALQRSTVQRVQYTDFSYSFESDASLGGPKMVTVEMNGIAPDYKAIALQTDAFDQNSIIKEPVISDIETDELTRQITFKLEFKVDARDVSYAKMLEEVPATAPAAPTAAPVTVSAVSNELSYE